MESQLSVFQPKNLTGVHFPESLFNFMKVKATIGRNEPNVGLGQITFSVSLSYPWKHQCAQTELLQTRNSSQERKMR